MISRLLKIVGFFCKRALKKRLYSAKETYDLKEPTNRSHPIAPALKAVLFACFLQCVDVKRAFGVSKRAMFL